MNKMSNPQSRRPTIAVLVTHFLFDYPISVLQGITDIADQYDVNLLCLRGGELHSQRDFENPAQGNILFDLVDPSSVDGVLLLSSIVGQFVDTATFLEFCQGYHPLPIVSIGEELPGIPSVVIDNYIGMYDLITHLITEHGCRRIAFIRGPEQQQEANERYRGYREALQEHNLPLAAEIVFPGDFDISAGKRAVEQLVKLGHIDVDAIVAANDYMAAGALYALQEHNIRIPQDVLVAGFDNDSPSQATSPQLTTVQQPIYEIGRRGAEMLLQLLNGQDAPLCVMLPAKLIIRRSCGCAESILVRSEAHSPADTADMQTFMQREYPDFQPEWGERLIRSIQLECEFPEQHPSEFLDTLGALLALMPEPEREVMVWHDAVTFLFLHTLPAMSPEARKRAEHLLHQARILINLDVQRRMRVNQRKFVSHIHDLRLVGAELISTFDLATLFTILPGHFRGLDIETFYLALYEDPQPYTYPQPAPEWSTLLLAYRDHRQIPLAREGLRFRTHDLFPQEIMSYERPYRLIVIPLYFQQKQLGFAALGARSFDRELYEEFRAELSSALQGALLVQSVRESALELTAAYQEIQKLNEQLQAENLRMSAELDISRRLQQMMLPSTEELQQIEGVDIVGFMQPADEVGGDYYDVLYENGTVHVGIGDVTGHGLESGVLMLMTQTSVRTLIEHGETEPVAFLTTLNRTIHKNVARMGGDKTLTLAFIQYQDRELKIIGQHEEVIVLRNGGVIERVDTVDLGFPLGLEAEIANFVDEATIMLNPRDSVVLYTDGIIEAENIQGEFYGIPRLCDVLSQHWQRSVEDIKQAVIDDVRGFIGQQKVYDDLTLVILRPQ